MARAHVFLKRALLGLAVSAGTSGCGFIFEQISDLSPAPIRMPAALNVPISPVYLAAADSYLKAEGPCQGYQVIEFTYSSALTPSNTVFKKCENDMISANLPVLQGDKSQVFTVKIVGYLAQPTATTPLPPNITVNYDPPPRLLAGKGVTSGGGKAAGPTAQIADSSVGEVVIGTQTSPSAVSRNGLQGAIDP
ncbi:MAG TPA: hypothetical protein VFV50_19630 [Bdellovibrionales bacterium]|nr:hypothetical protein [Bdellovibrionales bacterium]